MLLRVWVSAYLVVLFCLISPNLYCKFRTTDSAQDTVDQLLLTVLLRTVAKADALAEIQ
jgi:hypothetical protein